MIIAVRGVANVLTCCRPVGNFKYLPKVTSHTTVKSQVSGKKSVGPRRAYRLSMPLVVFNVTALAHP